MDTSSTRAAPDECGVPAEPALLYGQLRSEFSLEALLSRLLAAGLSAALRESSHFTGWHYLRLTQGPFFTFERVTETDYLLHGEADAVEALCQEARLVSETLRRLNLTHRIEVYDLDDELAAYLHHGWPQGSETS